MNQKGKGLESNYCRNPDGRDGGPWCFVSFYDPVQGTPPKFSYCEVECPNSKNSIGSVESNTASVSGLPMSSFPPMALDYNINLEQSTLEYYDGSSTAHVTNSPMTVNLFASTLSTRTTSTTTMLTSTTTTTTSTTSRRRRRTRPTRQPKSTTSTTSMTSTTSTSTTSTKWRRIIKTVEFRPTRRTRPSTTRRRRTTTSSTTTLITPTTKTRRRRIRPTQLTKSTSKTTTKGETWILPEVEGQKIEISDLEIDSSLEEYLYTTLPNPTFINALDTLRDWAANRKVEAVELPRINVRSNLGNLMQGMNSILKTDKHKK